MLMIIPAEVISFLKGTWYCDEDLHSAPANWRDKVEILMLQQVLLCEHLKMPGW